MSGVSFAHADWLIAVRHSNISNILIMDTASCFKVGYLCNLFVTFVAVLAWHTFAVQSVVLILQ